MVLIRSNSLFASCDPNKTYLSIKELSILSFITLKLKVHLIATHFSTIMNLCILSYIQEPAQSTVRGGEGRGTERFKSVIVFQPFISWVPTLGLTGGFILFTIWSASLAPCRAGNDKELYSNTRVSIPGELWMNL